jgi:hypothetical protein
VEESAGEDIREIERIVQENKSRETQVGRALDAADTEKTKPGP